MFQEITNFEYAAFAFKDTWKTIAIAIAFFLSIWLSLSWITTNIVGQTETVFIYSQLLYIGIAAYAANILKTKIVALQPLPFGTVPIGWNVKVVAIISLLGIALGWILIQQHLTIALPLDVTYREPIISMDFIYKVIMSPVVEEIWRATMLITSALIVWHFSKNWLLALLAGLLISSFAFGIFHWLAYQQDIAFIGAAIVFGLLAGMLMILSKSIVPSIALHFTNNQSVFSNGDPLLVIVLAALMLAMLLLAFFKKL